MQPETLQALQNEITEIDNKISLLLGDKEDIQALLFKHSDPEEIRPIPNFERVEKQLPKMKTVRKEKIKPEGKQLTMSKFLLNIMKAHPDRQYLPKDLEGAVQKAIDNGQLEKPSDKILRDGIAKRLYAIEKSGKICKQDSLNGKTFQYKEGGKKPREKNTKPELLGNMSKLDDAIINYMESHDDGISEFDLTNKIRLSADFADIAKELNGTLSNSVEKSVRSLLKEGILKESEPGLYCIKPF